MPKPFPSTADTDAMVARVALAILELLADGMPRGRRTIAAELADRHPKDEVRHTLMRLAVTDRVAETGGKYVLAAAATAGRLVGLTGASGLGKTTIADAVAARHPDAVPMVVLAPTPALALAAARAATDRVPAEVRRFRTGTSHHVYEAPFDDGRPTVVVRMGTPEQRAGLAEGVGLNKRLRPLGVPLPRVLAAGLDEPCPWVALERLPGTDLGHVIGALSDGQLRAVAEGVAGAQACAARIGAAGRYGYAAAPETAPDARWSDTLEANVARSRARIHGAGLLGPGPVETVDGLIEERRDELDAVPATAFLHDTTTKNVIVAPSGTLSGIVDVDDLCWGDPRYAPALTLAVLLAYGGPPVYVEHWMRAAGHRDDRLFRLYVALFLVDLMGEHGQRFNGNEGRSTPEARDRLLRAFGKAAPRARP